jgi:hypothetical protein
MLSKYLPGWGYLIIAHMSIYGNNHYLGAQVEQYRLHVRKAAEATGATNGIPFIALP